MHQQRTTIHQVALNHAMVALPAAITAPPSCVTPLTTAKPLPPAPALCTIAMGLPATMFPIEPCATANTEAAYCQHIRIQSSQYKVKRNHSSVCNIHTCFDITQYTYDRQCRGCCKARGSQDDCPSSTETRTDS